MQRVLHCLRTCKVLTIACSKQSSRSDNSLGCPGQLRQKIDESIKEQADLLHMTADYKVHLMKVLENAQRELLIPVTYPQEVDLATDEDEELRDIRANVFPPSD